jgi:antitoxin (DNA-binding transcriptional repressor) of toxin-antitoxin stability system
MNYITTTELRTRTPALVETLLHGGTVDIIHRSKTIGEIKPKSSSFKKVNSKKLEAKIAALPFPKLTSKEIDKRYRAAMMEKHGQGLS